MKSIIQEDKTKCFLCGKNACGDPLDKHHVFFGAMRSTSEKYGLTVYLHHSECHIFGKDSVHRNAKINRAVQAAVQRKAMQVYSWNMTDWLRIFHRNYIDESENMNRCVCCGEIIPEGKQVCVKCERGKQ